jgi:hypothetical protein
MASKPLRTSQRSTLSRPAGCDPPSGSGAPTERTFELVERELALVRAERDRYVADGRLKLAGECCVELEQLVREFVALRG